MTSGEARHCTPTRAPIAIPDAAREVKLIDNARDLFFEYYYKGPTDEKGSWVEEWTDKDNIPDRIRLTIDKDSKVLPLIIPVKAGINAQQVNFCYRAEIATMTDRHGDKQGIALILVIWILAILMVIVLSFAYMTKVESGSTISFKEGVEEKFIAEAGVERAAEEIMYRKINLGVPIEEGKEGNIWKTDGTPNTFTVGDGTCLVRIIDESGKLDINKVPDIVLKGLLIDVGVKDEDADTIVDSIEDWRDADDLVRLHGAESDYYMSLPVPYKAKNADFESVEELLLVKGMTPEILHGGEKQSGLADFVTVYSDSAQINVNAASKEVLMAIPGMTPELAGNIVDFRKYD